MAGLGGQGGVQGVGHSAGGGFRVELGAPIRPLQSEGGGGSGLFMKGDHAGEAGVGADAVDQLARLVIQPGGANQQSG